MVKRKYSFSGPRILNSAISTLLSYVPAVIEDTMNAGGGDEGETSRFFPYFMLLSMVCILAYLVFHNKQKVSGDIFTFSTLQSRVGD